MPLPREWSRGKILPASISGVGQMRGYFTTGRSKLDLPKPGSPNSAVFAPTSSRCTSRNPNGAGITAVITFNRYS